MRKGLDPFRVVSLLTAEETVESLACGEGCVYVGTSQGSLIQYDVPWAISSAADGSGKATGELSASVRKRGSVKLSGRHPVELVRTAPGFVFALAEGALSVLPSDLQAAPTAAVLSKDVKSFCIRCHAEDASQPPPVELCLSLRKKLVLYGYNGRSFEPRQEFPTAEPATTLVWHRTWICAGFRREYSLYSARAGVPREICHLDGKFPPHVVGVSGDELLLLIQEGVGLFYNLSTQQPSPKSTVTWPRRVTCLGSAGSYILGSAAGGQVDVFSVRDQKNCQTLMLDSSAVAVCTAPGGRALVAYQGGTVACLDPVPFERQLQMLLLQVRIPDAQDLLNASFGPEDPRRSEQLARFQALSGWALFGDLQFAQAFRHLSYAPGFPAARVLGFWRKHLPGDVDPVALLAAVGSSGGAGASAGGAENAPEPKDLEEFVRAQLATRRPSTSAGASPGMESAGGSAAQASAMVDVANAAAVTFFLRQRETLLACERPSSAQHDAKLVAEPGRLLRAMDTVLLKLLVDVGTEEVRLQRLLDAGPRCDVADCEGFLRQRRRFDVMGRLWKGQGMYEAALKQLSSMLNDGSAVGGNAGGPGPTFTRTQLVADMGDTLRAAATSPSGAALLRRYVPQLLDAGPAAALRIFVDDKGLALPSALSDAEVLELLADHEELVLGFLESRVLGKRGQAAQGVDPRQALRLGGIYLSQVSSEARAAGIASPQYEKVLRYLEETENLDAAPLLPKAEELALPEARVVLHCRSGGHGQALQILVEALNDLPRAEIYCRVVMARGAAAAAACASAAASAVPGTASTSAASAGARQAPYGGDAVSGFTSGSEKAVEGRCAVDASIFCSPPPAWAAPEVFPLKRGAGGGAAAEEEEAQPQQSSELPPDGPAALLGPAASGPSGPSPEELFGAACLRLAAVGAGGAAPGPLMLFLQALLSACAGAEKDPTRYPKVASEYREAVLSLLVGYAGHHDLPPNEVIGLLPADWTLDRLAGYLTKCTRILLHAQRAGMFEENLSSMAYLKTFDAVARERQKKVTITGDRCCPVSNRRFVDKDSVGKAFVAYPNETCVHFHCKEDIHVCPKTGTNFSDNLSVYCSALSPD
eukprot:TRINITY_DN16710_c0_g6_i1.p1 TRINITY_DN16710_c0_g6~~TRINITY_DN16710_c0_g6_i1.p1  ORF type:complete len:1102 (-),score=238.85 TRINITY_DN16710_c0_g6_i1:33-3338(-)